MCNREFCTSEVLYLHEFLMLLKKSFEEVETHLALFLHYYNLNNVNSKAPRDKMNQKVINYVKNNIHKSVKKAYDIAFKTRLFCFIWIWLSCLWDSNAENNSLFTIKFMYLNDRTHTMGLTSANVLHFMRILIGYLDDWYHLKLSQGQWFMRYLHYCQICNFGVQFLDYATEHIEGKIRQFFY